MQFFTTLALLASAATGALALPSGPVSNTPTPTIWVSGLTWNVTDNNLAVSFNVRNSVQSDTWHCEGASTNIYEKFRCAANPDIEFLFGTGSESGARPFDWFEVYWTFGPGVLANDGKKYLADGVNSLSTPTCTQACHEDSLIMQGRTTVITN